MPNPYVNKLEINGVTKLDLTADTVTASDVRSGVTAHDMSGAPITGTLTVPTVQASKSYSALSNGSFTITPDSGNSAMAQVSLTVDVPQAVPIEIDTDAGMTAVLTSANVGKVYKFTGTTGTYTNGDLYIVEVS